VLKNRRSFLLRAESIAIFVLIGFALPVWSAEKTSLNEALNESLNESFRDHAASKSNLSINEDSHRQFRDSEPKSVERIVVDPEFVKFED